ncbi:ABC transporter permease [Vallitalea guaymasensis]|uniref:ABC transporter permease n=1 Tax=Vallitalea guaymasensis TaxID=1185412 RepID=A0A8J8SB98_9FIRM|nr:ABC transporter permease [Vallitalea guaymasensis]QUH28121.1 ABC transporter permease [Vallitalea guaymasensis]
MGSYILKKMLNVIPVLIGITLAAFLLGVLSPGDPAYISLTRDGITEPSDEEIEEKQHELGLDLPVHKQYFNWLKKVIKLDFGQSIYTGESIGEELARRLPITLKLAMYGFILTSMFGILIGVIMTLFRGSFIDSSLRFFCTLISSIPNFWLAIILITIFAETLQILPTSGYESEKSLILPSIVVSLTSIGFIARLTRASFLKVLSKEFIVLANAKGLRSYTIGIIHIFKNGIIPVSTYLGLYFAAILGGSSIVESIFALPGIGSYAIESIYARDYYVIQAYVILTGTTYILVNLGLDLLYFAINPKIKESEC